MTVRINVCVTRDSLMLRICHLRCSFNWLWLGGMAFVLATWPWPAIGADTIRCGSRLVSVGALAAEVEARCGPPSYRDVEGYALPRGRGYAADVEIWTYNFGPDRLLEQLKFRNGRLVNINSDGYGFASTPPGHCGPSDIAVGMSKYRLLSECGEPISKQAEEVTVPLVIDGISRRQMPQGGSGSPDVGGYVQEVYREVWIYNFGPSYFLRKVILVNGRVGEVSDGKRGFAEP